MSYFKNIIRDIRKILDKVEIDTTQLCGVYKDQRLIERPCFNLPFRETNLVISSYSAKHWLAIFDRWMVCRLTVKYLKVNLKVMVEPNLKCNIKHNVSLSS